MNTVMEVALEGNANDPVTGRELLKQSAASGRWKDPQEDDVGGDRRVM